MNLSINEDSSIISPSHPVRNIEDLLPTESFVITDSISYMMQIGMKLEVRTTIAQISLVREPKEVIERIVRDWYHRMHDELVKSQVEWEAKIRR